MSKMRNFQADDFARFHPGGALGRKLSKVDDIMRPLRRMPHRERFALGPPGDREVHEAGPAQRCDHAHRQRRPAYGPVYR